MRSVRIWIVRAGVAAGGLWGGGVGMGQGLPPGSEEDLARRMAEWRAMQAGEGGAGK